MHEGRESMVFMDFIFPILLEFFYPPYGTVRYGTVPVRRYHTVLYSTVRYRYGTVLYRYRTVLYGKAGPIKYSVLGIFPPDFWAPPELFKWFSRYYLEYLKEPVWYLGTN